VTVASTKVVFQIFAVCIALYFLYWAYAGAVELAADGALRPPPRAVRLTVLALRDPAAPPAASNPFVLGLLRDGCRAPPAANSSNGTAVVTLAAPARANGYYLQVAGAGGPAGLDPVRWRVEAQAESGGDWALVGASMRRGQGALAVFYPGIPYPLPMASPGGEAAAVEVDGRAEWPWVLTDVGTYAVASAGWGLYAWFGWTGRQRITARTLWQLFLVNTVLQAAAAVGLNVGGDWRGEVESWMYCAADVVMGALLWWNEALVVPALLAFGFITISTQVNYVQMSKGCRAASAAVYGAKMPFQCLSCLHSPTKKARQEK
jgi:hypothetical protein